MPNKQTYDFSGDNSKYRGYVLNICDKVSISLDNQTEALAYIDYLLKLLEEPSKSKQLPRDKIPTINGSNKSGDLAFEISRLRIFEELVNRFDSPVVYGRLKLIQKQLSASLHRNIFRRFWTACEKIFEDMAEFLATGVGLALTIGIITAGVTAFIVLTCQYHLPAVAAYTFLGSVFGTFTVNLVGGQVYKHCGFFAGGGGPNGGGDASVEHKYEHV